MQYNAKLFMLLILLNIIKAIYKIAKAENAKTAVATVENIVIKLKVANPIVIAAYHDLYFPYFSLYRAILIKHRKTEIVQSMDTNCRCPLK